MRSTTDHERSEPGRKLLQRRLSLLCAVLTGINLLGLLLHLSSDPSGRITTLPIVLMAAITVGLAAAWAVCRGAPRSYGFLRGLEAAAMVLISVATGLIAQAIPTAALPLVMDPSAATEPTEEFIAELGAFGMYTYVSAACVTALTQTFVLRAALIPSTALRTLVLTSVGGMILFALVAVPIPGWESAERLRAEMPELAPAGAAGGIAAWWSMTTIVCLVVSWVVHGLRRQVRDAKRLGQYQLEAKLGEGGMGVVYRAKHALLRRPTAVKILPPDKNSEQDVARFEREVRLTASLTHPNTVRVFDYGHTPDGLFYYAMELLDGASLDEVVHEDGPQPPERTVHVLYWIAAALVEAHAHGLIHRDIKPGNIMLCDQGGERDVPKLLDFGLVKQLGDGGVALTQEQTITGTPAYLAPEVIGSAGAAGPKSDLYALGAVGYYLLTGTHVFTGDNVVEVCAHHLHTAPEPPSERLGARVPEALEEVILECLAKDPDERPASTADLRDRLETIEGVREWRHADRTAWWEEHAALLTERGAALDAGDTLVIDFADRTAGKR